MIDYTKEFGKKYKIIEDAIKEAKVEEREKVLINVMNECMRSESETNCAIYSWAWEQIKEIKVVI